MINFKATFLVQWVMHGASYFASGCFEHAKVSSFKQAIVEEDGHILLNTSLNGYN